MSMLTTVRRSVGEAVGSAASRALDLALPAVCAGCGLEGPPLCDECRPAIDVRLASQPGVPIGLPAEIPMPLLQLEWCAPFTGVTRQALHRLKYAGERRLAVPLGESLAKRWERASSGGDVLVPVPASPDRIRERGYDQAVLLAREAGRRLRLRTVEALVRTRQTAAQFDLDRRSRGGNVRGAFGVADGAPIRGSWVVLIDDVVTTWATLSASATALLEGGAMAVSAITVARER